MIIFDSIGKVFIKTYSSVKEAITIGKEVATQLGTLEIPTYDSYALGAGTSKRTCKADNYTNKCHGKMQMMRLKCFQGATCKNEILQKAAGVFMERATKERFKRDKLMKETNPLI